MIAAWGIVLLVAFLSYRGEDIARLGSLLGNIGGGPVFGFEGFIASVSGAVIAAFVGVAWFGLGSFVLRFLRPEPAERHSHILEFVMRPAVGAAVWSLIFFILGIAGAYNTAVAVICLAIGIGLAAIGFTRVREAREESRVPEKANVSDKLLLLLIALPVVLAFITSLAPPTAKDTLLYHFSVPKQFIAQGSSAFIEGNIASYLALGTEMHVVWSMLLGNIIGQRVGEAVAGAAVWMFFPLLLAAIFGSARELGISRSWSLIAVLIAATVPTAYHVAASAYIDLALALYITLAIYALTRWWKTPGTGWLVLIAIFLGAALSAKLTTLFVIAAFALVILLRARDTESASAGKLAAGGFAALMLAGVIASPWYLRTWAETGSPVFPFYMSIWEGEAKGWDVERSNLFQAMNSQYGGATKSAADHLLTPWNVSVSAQPERFEDFDGVLGFAFLFGLPIVIFALWKFELSTEAKICAGVAAIMFLFWMFSSQQLRYLLPIVPALAIAIVASVETVSSKRETFNKIAAVSLGVAAVVCLATTAAWFLRKAPVRTVLGGETRDAYLARNLDHYPYYQWINTETPADVKVWLINMRRDSYHLDRPYFSDYLFEDWTFRRLVWNSSNAAELKKKAKAETGAEYVLVRHDILLNENTPIYDPDRTTAENDAKLRLAKEFILEGEQVIRSDKKFSLVKVF